MLTLKTLLVCLLAGTTVAFPYHPYIRVSKFSVDDRCDYDVERLCSYAFKNTKALPVDPNTGKMKEGSMARHERLTTRMKVQTWRHHDEQSDEDKGELALPQKESHGHERYPLLYGKEADACLYKAYDQGLLTIPCVEVVQEVEANYLDQQEWETNNNVIFSLKLQYSNSLLVLLVGFVLTYLSVYLLFRGCFQVTIIEIEEDDEDFARVGSCFMSKVKRGEILPGDCFVAIDEDDEDEDENVDDAEYHAYVAVPLDYKPTVQVV